MIYQKVLIYIDALQPLVASWVVFDEHGKVIQSVTRGDLKNLLPNARSFDTTVIVPAPEVVLTRATLPKLSRQRLLQALPFALEEELIDDVSELHFATADYQADGTVPVAIVAKEKIMNWLVELHALNIHPHEMISSIFALPYHEKTWEAGIQADCAALRTGAYSGFSCDRDNLPALLELSLAETNPQPETIQLYNFSETALLPLSINSDTTVLNLVKLNEATFLESVAGWTLSYPKINLLQGAFQAKQKSSSTKKIWLYACLAFFGWLTLGLCKNMVAFFILHHQNSQLDTAINTIYKKNFPQATAVVAPRERMESKLKELTNSAGNNLYLLLLAKTGSALKDSTDVKLKNLDFRNNQLTLALNAATFDDIDKFMKKLTQHGLTVKEQNAAVSGDQVQANLLIQRGSA